MKKKRAVGLRLNVMFNLPERLCGGALLRVCGTLARRDP